MWHKQKNKNPIIRLALLLALASTPMMTSLFKSDYVLGQSPETPSFPLPTEVEKGTTIKVDGSTSMTRANQALKQRFEKEYSGTNVEVATNGTDDALKALQDGNIDIAAIGRGLTPEEEELGLEQQPLRREKIAIIVGKDNPFQGDLSNQRFTQIYRGQIDNWSELGGPSKPIRVIDRPESSDTRQAFNNYPLFDGNLNTGSTATKLDTDDPAEVIKQLGEDGIGFVLANQVEKLGDNVRVLSMHKVPPTDARYPYSQPLVYVFKKNPSQAVKNFVGFATAEPGQEALNVAREEEAVAVAAAVAAVPGNALDAAATPASTQAATGNATANNGAATENVSPATNTSATDSSGTGDPTISRLPSSTSLSEAGEGTIPWWWILLPVAAIGALALWWLLGRRKSQEDDTVARGVLPENSPPPFTPTSTTTGPVKEPEPVVNTPIEPNAGVNTAPVEPAPNTTSGINAAGIAAGAGIAGLGAAGAAALSSDNQDTPEVGENNVRQPDVPDSELNAQPTYIQQPDSNEELDSIEAPDLEQPDIPDTSLDLEAPAAVVNSSYHSLPRINTTVNYVEAPPITEDVGDSTPIDNRVQSDSPQEELPPASTNSWLGNFSVGAGVAGAAATDLPGKIKSGAEKIKSQFAGKETPQSTEDESVQINGTAYPQLPDVWDSTQADTPAEGDTLEDSNNTVENNDTISPSDLWGPLETAEPITQEEEETSFDNVEQPQQTSPSSLWGTPETEVSTDVEEESLPLDSAVINQDVDESVSANNIEEQPLQETSASSLWGTPETEEVSTQEEQEESSSFPVVGVAAAGLAAGAAAIGLGLFNRDNNDTDENNTENQDDTQASEVVETNENEQADAQTTPQEQPTTDGLPNAWVNQSDRQTTIPEEKVDEQEVTQFGASSTSGDTASTGGAALADVGAFTLSQMTSDDEESQQAGTQPQNEALDQIANQAEIDTQIRLPGQHSDPGDTDWDRIYGIHHNGATGVPGESNILLANRTPKWAYASWNIAPADREAIQERGANQLVLRLYDVTNVDLSYQNAKIVQQYECEESVSHRYVAIPNADRDYITEIGYLTVDKEWLLLSRSPIIRVFNRPHKDFWFEADAELIIHGATEPGSTVTIDGQNIKVKQDGTFHLRVPFTESLINYLITAVAPNSEQAKTIHMQFSQTERKDT
ncbi:substrate-binding domain-containing protein [Calothrix sp. CCY 0018]|uniref:substrate-binding domain-containing protein n=1 Tax=Calothrix sp. CCY 0018 TaxID=3103864 RepID=UPI0039C64005